MKSLKKWILKWLNPLLILFISLGFIILIPAYSIAQQLNLPLNHAFDFDLNKSVLHSNQISHTAFKPVLVSAAKKTFVNDSNVFYTTDILKNPDKSFVSRKLFNEHLITLDTGKVKLTIDPLLNLEYGNELNDDPRDITLYKSTRGFNVKLSLGDKVSIESSFRENQANLPEYLSYRVDQTHVAYGQGRVKKFKDYGYDFAMASAYISYSPSDRINIQAGHGKHFVGNGYRSLLLSDLSFNYPFLKINTNWFDNKLQYQNMYTVYQDLERINSTSSSEGLYERKQGAFHFLEFSPNHNVSIGIFEGVIFPSIDSSGNIPVGVNYWIPVIFLNTLMEDSEDINASVIGTNISVRLIKQLEMYNQFSIPKKDFANPGFQVGFKWYLLKYFMLQGELNMTSAYDPQNQYTHYNQSLNHPIFDESLEYIGIVQFQKNRWQSRLKVNYFNRTQPDIQYVDLKQSYIVNYAYNFTVHLGAQYRNQTYYDQNNGYQSQSENAVLPYNNSSFYVYFGLSTNLQNLYFDY